MLTKANTAKTHDKNPIIKRDFARLYSEIFFELNFNIYLKLRITPVRTMP